MNKIFRLILVVLAVTVVGLAILYGGSMRPTAEPSGRMVSVQRGDIIQKINETGSVEPATVVEIKSEQSGEIKRLFVKQGDRVKIGQGLAVIQQESGLARQAAQFRAGLEEERLNREGARRELERQRSLFKKGFVSRKDVEVAEKDFEKSRVKFHLARRQLLLVLGGSQAALKQHLARDLSSDALDQFTIFSPIPGTVISMDVEKGEMITSGTATIGGGTALMKIADLTRMRVRARINEVNIAQVHPGQPVEIRLDALPGKVYHATVSQISPQGERINNIVTYQITMEIVNPDLDLKPSMTADVDIITRISKAVLYLPVEAVELKGGRAIVTLERSGRRFDQTVSIGARTESRVEISDGLKEGDRVLVRSEEEG